MNIIETTSHRHHNQYTKKYTRSLEPHRRRNARSRSHQQNKMKKGN